MSKRVCPECGANMDIHNDEVDYDLWRETLTRFVEYRCGECQHGECVEITYNLEWLDEEVTDVFTVG